MQKVYLLLLVLISFTCHAQTTECTGIAFGVTNNSKDIYHKRNFAFRKQLMQQAVFDAVEKGSKIRIVNHQNYTQSEKVANNVESHFESYLSNILQAYNVSWQRQSSYSFVNMGNKKWQCTVRGLVENLALEFKSNPHVDTYKPNRNNNSEQYLYGDYVTRKSYNKVHLSIGREELRGRQKIVVQRLKEKQTSNGLNTYKKTKALLWVTHSEDDFTVARIIKGFWRVKQGDEVEVKNFRNGQSGLKLEYSTMLSDEEDAKNESYSVAFYTESMRTHLGFSIGYEQLQTNSLPADISTLNCVHLGLHYNMAIIPDILYLVPELKAGYNLEDEKLKDYMYNNGDYIAMTNYHTKAKINSSLRIGIFNFDAGYGYSYYSDWPGLTGKYLSMGLRIKLY